MRNESNVSGRIAVLATMAALGISAATPAGATVVFSDGFDDGDVSDWSKTTNYAGTTAVSIRNDLFVSPSGALFVYLDAPPGGSALNVRASHGFNAPVAGDYTLGLSARSAPCDGCTISYDILVDGVLLDRRSAASAFDGRNFSLNGLTAGAHTLTLGMFTIVAFAGRFNASFDDVVIATAATAPETPVPLPASIVLVGTALASLTRLKARSSGQ